MTGFVVGLFIGLLIAMAMYLRCKALEEELDEIRFPPLDISDEEPPAETEWLSRDEFRKVKEGAHTITGGILRGEKGPTKFGLEWDELKELSVADQPEEDRPHIDGDLSSIGVKHHVVPIARPVLWDHDNDDSPPDVPPA